MAHKSILVWRKMEFSRPFWRLHFQICYHYSTKVPLFKVKTTADVRLKSNWNSRWLLDYDMAGTCFNRIRIQLVKIEILFKGLVTLHCLACIKTRKKLQFKLHEIYYRILWNNFQVMPKAWINICVKVQISVTWKERLTRYFLWAPFFVQPLYHGQL